MGNYSRVDPGYGMRFRRALQRAGLAVAELPHFQEQRECKGIPSAVVNYVNFLRIGKLGRTRMYGRSAATTKGARQKNRERGYGSCWIADATFFPNRRFAALGNWPRICSSIVATTPGRFLSRTLLCRLVRPFSVSNPERTFSMIFAGMWGPPCGRRIRSVCSARAVLAGLGEAEHIIQFYRVLSGAPATGVAIRPASRLCANRCFGGSTGV